MDQYQKDLYEKFSSFLIERNEAPYPPDHEGEYLEEYFAKKFLEDGNQYERYFIPVHWTAVFNHKASDGLGPSTENNRLRTSLYEQLDKLPKGNKYFTVSTHDDAPSGPFPHGTRHFYAGGNATIGTDPIPLIWSGFKKFNDAQKMIFCSFVGSVTHDVRMELLSGLNEKDGYLIKAFHWQQDVPDEQKNLFKAVIEQSRFTLCPRGYGTTSYRLYEAMQVGSIPVYVSDKLMLPWNDELDWSEFCVVISANRINDVDQILKGYTESEVRAMQDRLHAVYSLYFTIPATYNQIVKRL